MQKLNKNQTIGIGVLIVIIVVVAFAFFSVPPAPISDNTPKEFVLKEGCEETIEQGVFQLAMNNNDLVVCGCESSIENIVICKESVLNTRYYNQAINNTDLSLCDAITDEAMAGSCVNLVNQDAAIIITEAVGNAALNSMQKQEFDDAIKIMDGMLDKNREDVEVLITLAIAYANKALFEHEEESLIPKAFELVEEAKALAPEYPAVYHVEGFVYEVQPDLVEAVNSYTTAIELDDEFIEAYIGRAHAHNKFGDLFAAMADFEKAKELDVNMDYMDVYSQLCRLYSTNSEYVQGAVVNCKIVINDGTADYDNLTGAHVILSDIYMRQGDYELAKEQLNIALQYLPKSPDVHTSLAVIYNITGEFDLAEDHSRIAISEDSIRATAHMALADALRGLGKFDEAIETALDGLDYVNIDASLLKPSKDSVRRNLYYILALSYHDLGDLENEATYAALGDAI